jgi:hypothetical protein
MGAGMRSRAARSSIASLTSQVRGPRITGQRLGSVQWVGQIQSANETYLTRSGEVTSYGVPGPSDSARDSTILVGHRFRARRSSH